MALVTNGERGQSTAAFARFQRYVPACSASHSLGELTSGDDSHKFEAISFFETTAQPLSLM